MNDVIILAGGLGTRLSHLVPDTQKVMAPVCGRPFVYYLIKRLTEKGCRRIIFAVSYHSEQVRNYCGNSYGDTEFLYSVEQEPLGTGGAIKKASALAATPDITVINGDTFFDIDINALEKKHSASGADISIAVRKLTDINRSGTVTFEADGKLISFNEREELEEGYINGGIYVIKRTAALGLPDGKVSFEKDVLEKKTFLTYCFKFDSYFIDIGVPADYFRAHTEIPLRFGINKFPVCFLDRDGVICKEKDHLYKPEDFEFIPGVPEALARIREMGYLIIVLTNQAGVAKGYYTEEDVRKLHEYMLEQLEGIAYIDAIYYCPYYPDGVVEKYRKNSRDRKPGTGMIEKALWDLSRKGIILDLENSIMVGDTENDILTAKRAQIETSFLVRSGHSIPDEKATEATEVLDSLCDVVKQPLREQIWKNILEY